MRTVLAVSLGLVLCAGLAVAGPPLICHQFEIGSARSLPWGSDWNSRSAGYDVSQLVPDTLRLLTPQTPILVRMETLRRATLYGATDQKVAYELLARMMSRALAAESEGRHDPMAWFDAGYLVESYKQASFVYQHMMNAAEKATWELKQNPVDGIDGYVWVKKAIGQGGDAPAMEFAASLMLEGSAAKQHRSKAVAGATEGSLLARNIRLLGEGVKSSRN